MLITIILTICVFVSWLLIPHNITRVILGSLFTIALLGVVIGITGNMTNHWGMEKKVITSKSQEIYSAGDKNSPLNILITKEIGQNTNNYVMMFKTHKNDKKAQAHFKPNMDRDNISEAVKHQANYRKSNVDHATVQNKKEVWVWKTDFYKALFSFGEDKPQLIKSTTTVTLPKKGWAVLSVEQAKQLQKMQQNKNMDPKKQQAMMKQILSQ